MTAELQQGFFVLADISGYTSYLADVELQHAQGLLAELLEQIVARFRSALILSRLEGDAVFAYAPRAMLPGGEVLLDLIEATYADFRDRQEAFRHNACDCDACQSLPTLDLKFIIHFGEYSVQRVSGFQELVGTDVNLAHRLMKNHLSEATHWRAYVLFTEAALEQMGLARDGLYEQTEIYSHLRPVKTYSLNLQLRYQQQSEARRVSIDSNEADLVLLEDFSLPPHEVWTWLNDSQKRLQWEGFSKIRSNRPAGAQRGVGATVECTQGRHAQIETFLDWKPFECYTAQFRVSNVPGLRSLPIGTIETLHLDTTETGGTRLRINVKVQLPLPGWLARPLTKPFLQMLKVEQKYRRLAQTANQGPACELPAVHA